MDALGSDLLLHVIQYLSVRDLARWSTTSKRIFYLARKYQELLTECASSMAESSQDKSDQDLVRALCHRALDQIQSEPNLAIHIAGEDFTTSSSSLGCVEDYLPDGVITLSVQADTIQPCVDNEGVDCCASGSLMLISMPNATVSPFIHLSNGNDIDSTLSRFRGKDNGYWKVFIVFAGSRVSFDELPRFIRELQEEFPLAVIVGGVGSCCFASTTRSQKFDALKQSLLGLPFDSIISIARTLKVDVGEARASRDSAALVDKILREEIEEGPCALEAIPAICGVGLGGDVPVRAIVSRGVQSLTCRDSTAVAPPFYVESARLVEPGYHGDGDRFHLVDSIKDRESGRIYSVIQFLSRFGHPHYQGIRREDADGFKLTSFSIVNEGFAFPQESYDDESVEGYNFDVFALEAEAILADLSRQMNRLKEITENEDVLGGLMFSCSARGPHSFSPTHERMSDAKCFARCFAGTPCIGFYANGEIGPEALATSQNIFRLGDASLQGFTAVFAVFIAPKLDVTTFHLDDSLDSVSRFLRDRLQTID